MSFILDALKKSETERQQNHSAEFASVPSSADSPRAPRWLWVLIGLLAINIAVLLGLLMRDDTPPDNAPADGALSALPAPAVETDPSTSSFENRLREARENQHRPATTGSSRAAADAGNTGNAAMVDTPPAGPAQPAVGASSANFTLRELPTAAELRANGTLQMAEMHLDIHVYSDAPPDRFVFINMVKHRENSQTAEGPVVREITPEGVILDYRGTEFLLPRE